MDSPFQNYEEYKEYLEGLKDAVHTTLDAKFWEDVFRIIDTDSKMPLDGFPDISFNEFHVTHINGKEVCCDTESATAAMQMYWFMKRVYAPLKSLAEYRYNNRILKLQLLQILEKEDAHYYTPLYPDAIFDLLKKLNNSMSVCILSIISGPSSKLFEQIRQAYLSDDRDGFIKLCSEENYDLVKGSKVLRACEGFSVNTFSGKASDFLRMEMELGSLKDKASEKHHQYSEILEAVSILESFQEEELAGQVFLQYNKKHSLSIKKTLEEASIALVKRLLTSKYPMLTEEKELFDKIVNCNIFRKQYEKAKLSATELHNNPKLESSSTIREESKSVDNYISIDGNESIVKNEKKAESIVDSEPKTKFAFRPLTDADDSEINAFKISDGYFKNAKTKADCPHFDNLKDEIKGTPGLSKKEFKTLAANYQKFIRTLAREGCIYPNRDVMRSCAYAFSGITFNRLTPTKVTWNPKKIDCLFFICRYFYKSTNYDRAFEVFDVGYAKDYFSNPSAMTDHVDPSFKNEINNIYNGLV